MRSDPPVRPDGLCVLCGGVRKHAVWNQYGGAQAMLDPWCSSTCCRAWHSAEDNSGSPTLVNYGVKSATVTRSDTAYRRRMREERSVPCEDCGKAVPRERKDHTNPDRPYLCITCHIARRRVKAAV